MKPELRCDEIRADISAFVDGELRTDRHDEVEDHVASCRSCAAEESSIRSVRKLLRVQAIEDVPDLTHAIMARIPAPKPRAGWTERFRVGAIAAAASALVVFGSTLPFDRDGGDVAAAGEISRLVRDAARSLEAYRARFSIVERGWHPEVPVRRMTARLDFAAPENLRLQLTDRTDYPDAEWPRNDVTLIAASDTWWIREPSSCPEAALPHCASPTTWAGVVETRRVTNREPFDGASPLPTDIIVPLETLAAAEGFEVRERATVAGRAAYRLTLEYRQAVPLVGAIQQGGAWRELHPLDRVDLWIDTETWFPLRFRVVAGDSPDRDWWSTRHGVDDEPGDVLLEVRARGFSEPDGFPPGTFRAPSSGITRDGGFRPAVVSGDLATLDPPGLQLYRSGTAADGSRLVAYASGMSYLKVVRSRGALSPEAAHTGEEISLGSRGVGYYLPATETAGRRLEIRTTRGVLQLHTNLSRATLIDVASQLHLRGRAAPVVVERAGGVSTTRIDPAMAFEQRFAARPTYLPDGYSVVNATVSRAADGVTSVTAYLRRSEGEFDGAGIRLVQAAPVRFLPPSSEEFVEVALGHVRGRWSTERSELEWIDGRFYRAVAVPSADLYTAIRIARGLR
ncbi:MAG TPA: zf-HC2 domain-containing protein [Actinomycetota bacterium]|nr:zf-HC2 domain-containing protein [Actinomycetota bacterium]